MRDLDGPHTDAQGTWPPLCRSQCPCRLVPAYAQPEGISDEAEFALYCGGIFASITAFDISQEDRDLAQAKCQVGFTGQRRLLEDGVPDSANMGLLYQYVKGAMDYLVSDGAEVRYTADECNEFVGG